MAIDAQIPLMVRPVADPAEGMGRAMSLAALAQQGRLQQVQLEQAQREQEDQRSLADLYRGAIGADGKLDRSAVLQGAASRGLGAKIPALQKGWAETDKATAELDGTQIKNEVERASYVSNLAGRLALRPGFTRDDVIRELQAAPAQFQANARQFAAMLPEDPAQLQRFLAVAGASADKRLEILTPKLEFKDTGKQLVPVDMNAWTNPSPQALTKTTTPGEDMADRRTREEGAANRSVTIRGQDKTAASAAAGREQAERHFQAGGWQYDSKRGGLVNTRTGEFKPATQDGVPLAPDDKTPTESELNASGYAVRMTEATKLLDRFEKSGKATATTNAAGSTPLVGGLIQRGIMTPEQQQYEQAKRDWVRAKLRKESGAAIGADEEANEYATYFPMPNDGPEVIEQKRQARAVATAGMVQSGGRAYKQATPPASTKQPGPAAPSAPKVGTVDGGYLYAGGDPADPKSWKKVGK